MSIRASTLAALSISIALFAVTSPAVAGADVTLAKSDGSKVHIVCNETGCSAIIFDGKGNRVATEISDGGNWGYAQILEKFKAKGYK